MSLSYATFKNKKLKSLLDFGTNCRTQCTYVQVVDHWIVDSPGFPLPALLAMYVDRIALSLLQWFFYDGKISEDLDWITANREH